MKSQSGKHPKTVKNRLHGRVRRMLLEEVALCLQQIAGLDEEIAGECRRLAAEVMAVAAPRRRPRVR